MRRAPPTGFSAALARTRRVSRRSAFLKGIPRFSPGMPVAVGAFEQHVASLSADRLNILGPHCLSDRTAIGSSVHKQK